MGAAWEGLVYRSDILCMFLDCIQEKSSATVG